MRRLLKTTAAGFFVATLAAIALAAAACSSSSSPVAPASVAGVNGDGLSGPSTQPGPCKNGDCKGTLNYSLAVISVDYPVVTYIVGAVVTITGTPPFPAPGTRTETSHHHGDVDFHIPVGTTQVTVQSVTVPGYCLPNAVTFSVPAGADHWIVLTGC